MNNPYRNTETPNSARLKLPAGKIIFWALTLSLSIGSFFFVRRLTACWQLTALPGIPPAYCEGAMENPTDISDLDFEGTPIDDTPADVEPPEGDMPQWDGGSRVNIVFFGLRGGEISGADCPACTDTIILLTVDPGTKTAGMLSIPRDLWVNIPGFGYSRINTAWTLGEAAKLPGGGPGLAMETLSQFIGVPVHYFVQVDFGTFVSLINMIGGVDIYSDEKLKLDPSGSGQDHFVLTCCGVRHLDGRRALAYARCRSESQGCIGGDVGRAKRQQKVILAVRDKVFDPAYFPQLLAQTPQLYATFSSGIHTNMPLEDAMKLAVLAKDIPVEAIRQGVIDSNMASFENVTLGGVPASVLRPIPDMIRVLRDEIFTPGGPLSPLAQGDPVALMQEDGARVRVVNNTYAADLDVRTANFLSAQGMQVVEYGVSTGWSGQTVLVVYSPRLYTLRYLTDVFAMGSDQIVFKPDPAATVDIEIRIGEDWVGRLPDGY
jgi:LCP family protein required for cell wall assembly